MMEHTAGSSSLTKSILAGILAVAGAVTSVIGIFSGPAQLNFVIAFIGGVVFVLGVVLLVLVQLRR